MTPDERRRPTSKQRSLSLGKMEHHVSSDNKRIMIRLNSTRGRASHNALRAGTSSALQVRARETVPFLLIAWRWVAIRAASSSVLKTRSDMTEKPEERGREKRVRYRRGLCICT